MTLREDIEININNIFSEKYNERDARVVPTSDGIELSGGAKNLNAAFLYADLIQSSNLIRNFDNITASKIIKAYLVCMCKLIRNFGGEITSFDGDRVMGVFIGENKNTNATLCALQMGFVVSDIINPAITDYFKRIKPNYFTGINIRYFKISHCAGVDSSEVTVVKAGIRGTNDLIWIGNAPNLAAKLSDQRYLNYTTYISENVFTLISDQLKFESEKMVKSDHVILPNILNIPIPVKRKPIKSIPLIKMISGLKIQLPQKSIWQKFQLQTPNRTIT